jgi:predicted phage terminase large subunit-like protein
MSDPDHDRQVLNAILRNDLKSFMRRSFASLLLNDVFHDSWHIDAIAYHLELCRLGKIKRSIITLPPRSGKSIMASVAFPAFVLGHDPTRRIICASYAQDLSLEFSRSCRNLMREGWYRDIFPGTRLDPSKSGEVEFKTDQRGYRMATSVGGTITGRGGNFVIIDDPLKPGDASSKTVRTKTNEWFDNTLYSRLDNKAEDVIIIVTQRTHIDDLVGHLKAKGEEWTHLNLPAIAEKDERIPVGPGQFHYRKTGDILHPQREPREVLDNIRSFYGSAVFSAQYQQDPVPEAGHIVKRDWLRTYDDIPPMTSDTQIFQSWDTAQKAGELNDYSVCVTAYRQKNLFYIVDVYRARLDYPSLKQAVVANREAWLPDTIIVEDKASGIALCQELPRQHMIHPVPFTPEGDKVMRLSTQSSKIEAGQVLLPSYSTDWRDAFVDELVAFPAGRHDDQVDALTQLLQYVSLREQHVWTSGPLWSIFGHYN